MKLDAPLVELFDHPVDALLAALPSAEDAMWEKFARRRAMPMHAATRTIAFLWVEDWNGVGEPAVWQFDYAPPALLAAAQACAERLAARFGGSVSRLMLVDLPAGAAVAEHRDVRPGVTLVHRCHLPVVTNDRVSFTIDGMDHRLEAGRCYEFDNTRKHAVANRGGDWRVHLICDILPPADQRGA